MDIQAKSSITPTQALDGVVKLKVDVNAFNTFSRKQRSTESQTKTFQNVTAENIIFDGDLFQSKLNLFLENLNKN